MEQKLNFLSICSGIEAASVAWESIGWTPMGFLEIDEFPSAVLKHHYQDVPNYGDMTNYMEWQIHEPIDVICGGTPCQAFSVAGQRKSLEDARGNLSLTFCKIADHFDPEIVIWENVPGVLSTKDNAFGCFLAELAGLSEPILPPPENPNTMTLGLLTDQSALSHGVFSMLNTSDWPNAGDVSLSWPSEVLETGEVPQRYFLSPRACQGILNRAERRGKKIPPVLMEALERVALQKP